MSNVNVEELVDVYLKIREERERVLRQYEAEDSVLKADMAEVEAMMLAVCNDVNADSIKTQYGTVMRKLNERFYCNDWDGFRKFVLNNGATSSRSSLSMKETGCPPA